MVLADIPDRNVGIDPLAALVAGAPTAYGPAILIPVSRRRTFQPARTGSAIADLGRQPRRPPLTSSFWRPGGASLIPACMGRIPSPCRPAPPRGPDRRSGRERYQSATKTPPKHYRWIRAAVRRHDIHASGCHTGSRRARIVDGWVHVSENRYHLGNVGPVSLWCSSCSRNPRRRRRSFPSPEWEL